MKILIDIGHPAHVHYFRNFINMMKSKGHTFLIIARKKDVSQVLLNEFGIEYISRGKGLNSLIGKIVYTIYADTIVLLKTLKYKPNIMLSFASPYTAHISKLLNIPSITLTDTEHAKLGNLGFVPFSDYILTPDCFDNDFKNKHIRFSSFMELSYLSPKYFKPDSSVLKKLGVDEKQKFVLLRFVSWQASHDYGSKGLTKGQKIKLAESLSSKCKLFISSEGALPEELKRYKLSISPTQIHDVLSYASLVITEGATMASECAMLGTPVVYINPLSAGTIKEQINLGLLYQITAFEDIVFKSLDILNSPFVRQTHNQKKSNLLSEKIDMTSFMTWFIENFPSSAEIMKTNPDYQYRFK